MPTTTAYSRKSRVAAPIQMVPDHITRAFEAFYTQAQPSLRVYALARCNHQREDAEDVLQEVVVRVLPHWHKILAKIAENHLTPEEAFSCGWKYMQIAIHHVAVDMYRRRGMLGGVVSLEQTIQNGRTINLEDSENFAGTVGAGVALTHNREDPLVGIEQRETISDLLGRCPPQMRMAMLMNLAGYTTPESYQLLKDTPWASRTYNGFKSALTRARAELRGQDDDGEDDDSGADQAPATMPILDGYDELMEVGA